MLNEYSIDLHMHSELSDGKESPVQVIDMAAEIGLKKIVLCDHNALHPSFEKLQKYGASRGVELPFMGCEVTTVYYRDRFPLAVFHMLVYGEEKNINVPEFKEAVGHYDDRFNKAALRNLRRLIAAGAPVTFDDAFIFDRDIAPMEKSAKYSDDRIIKCVAEKQGISIDEAKEKYADCLEEYVYGSRGWMSQLGVMPDAAELVRLARRLGLVTVVAHPTWMDGAFYDEAYDPKDETKMEIIRDLRRYGLDGIETCHQQVESEARAKYEALAAELGMITTGGSDYHAEADYGQYVTEYGVTEEGFEKLARLVKERSTDIRL